MHLGNGSSQISFIYMPLLVLPGFSSKQGMSFSEVCNWAWPILLSWIHPTTWNGWGGRFLCGWLDLLQSAGRVLCIFDFFWGCENTWSRWWFQTFFFSSLPGEMIQFDEHIFQMGWFNHQPIFVGCECIFSVPPWWRIQIVLGAAPSCCSQAKTSQIILSDSIGICLWIFMYIWVFPKIGVPPNHPF